MLMRKAPPGREAISQDVIVKPFGPAQHAIRSGSAHALQTRLRGASKMRVMTSSRSADSVAALLVAAIFLLLHLRFLLFHLQVAQINIQTIEALLPEAAIILDPVGGVPERTRLEPARTPLRLAAARDQAGALQHLEMLGDRRKAHLEGFSQFSYRGLACGEASENRAPGGIGERGEGGIEVGRHLWNRGVNRSVK